VVECRADTGRYQFANENHFCKGKTYLGSGEHRWVIADEVHSNTNKQRQKESNNSPAKEMTHLTLLWLSSSTLSLAESLDIFFAFDTMSRQEPFA
jgi:hypothetical protein